MIENEPKACESKIECLIECQTKYITIVSLSVWYNGIKYQTECVTNVKSGVKSEIWMCNVWNLNVKSEIWMCNECEIWNLNE